MNIDGANQELIEQLKAEIKELEGLIKMHVPNVEILLKTLKESPYPTENTEWYFIEKWADQFLRLHRSK
jgi:ribosomal protein S19E (S16A)